MHTNKKIKPSRSDEKIESPTSGSIGSRGSGGQVAMTTPTKKTYFNSNIGNNLSPKASNENTNLDMSNPKCESISSSEKEIEYLRVVFPHNPRNSSFQSNIGNELNVDYNEIVKLIEDDCEGLDCDKSYIKVFNSRGVIGMIPSSCVEPILDHQLNSFIFLRHPTNVGHFANNSWYFGNISRFDTILLMNKYASSGEFLVRDSEVRLVFKT